MAKVGNKHEDGQTDSTPEISELLEELKSVSNWQALLVELGMGEHEIEQSQVEDVALQKREAFAQWLHKKQNATWQDIIKALFKLDETDLAIKLTMKYNQRDSKISAQKLNLVSAPTFVHISAECVSHGSRCLKLLPELSDDEKYYTLHAPTFPSYTNPAKLIKRKILEFPRKGHNLYDYLKSIEKSDFKLDFKVGLEVRFGTVYWKLKPDSVLKEGSSKNQWEDSKLLRKAVFNPEVEESDLNGLLTGKEQQGNGVQISLTIKFTFERQEERVYSVLISASESNNFTLVGVYQEADPEIQTVRINIAIPDWKYDMRLSDCCKRMVSEEANSTAHEIASTIVKSLHRMPTGKIRLILRGKTKDMKNIWKIKFIRQRAEILYSWKPQKKWVLACYDVDVFDPESNQTMNVDTAPLDTIVDIPEFDYSRKEVEFWGRHVYPNEINKRHSSGEIQREVGGIKLTEREIRPLYDWTAKDLMSDFEEFLGDAFKIAQILDGSFEDGGTEEAHIKSRPSLKSLLSELEEILNWQQLMINMGVKKYKNDEIEQNFPQDVDCQKQEAFDRWLKETPDACWKDIIDALFEMKENTLARKLTKKYSWKDPRITVFEKYVDAHPNARLAAIPVPDDLPCRQFLSQLNGPQQFYTLKTDKVQQMNERLAAKRTEFFAQRINNPTKNNSLLKFLESIEKSDYKMDFKVGLEVRFGKVYWKFKPQDVFQLANSTNNDWHHSKVDFNTEVMEDDIEKLFSGREQLEKAVTRLTLKFVVEGQSEGIYSAVIATYEDGTVFYLDAVYRQSDSQCTPRINIALPGRKYDIRIGDCSECMILMEPKESAPYSIADTIVHSLCRLPNKKLRLILRGNMGDSSWKVKYIRQKLQRQYKWKPERKWVLVEYDVDVFDSQTNQSVHADIAPLNKAINITKFNYSRKEVELWGRHIFPKDVNKTHPSRQKCYYIEGVDGVTLPGGEVRPPYNWTAEDLMSDFEEFLGDAFKIAQILDGSLYTEIGNGLEEERLYSAIVFLRHPQDVKVKPGSRVELSVEVSKLAQSYKWLFQDGVVSDEADYSGTTTKNLVIEKCLPQHKGAYRCVATDEHGEEFPSESASLTIDGELMDKNESKLLGEILQKAGVSPSVYGIDIEQLADGKADVTYEEMQNVLKDNPATYLISVNLKEKIKTKLEEERLYNEAMANDKKVSLSYTKILALGPSQVGKSTFLYRLLGLMDGNIQTANPSTQPQSSTGITEMREAYITYTSRTGALTSDSWQVFDESSDLQCQLEGLMSLITEQIRTPKLISQHVSSAVEKDSDVNGSKQENHDVDGSDSQTTDKETEINATQILDPTAVVTESDTSSKVAGLHIGMTYPAPQNFNIGEVILEFEALFDQAKCKLASSNTKFCMLFNIADIGGQPAFLEMLPSLTIGPALYLVFMKLLDGLSTRYPVLFKCKDRRGSKLCKNYTYTSEEVIFTALSSIACFGNSDEEVERCIIRTEDKNHTNSLAVLVGTFKDKVKDTSDLDKIDAQLEQQLEETEFFSEGLVHSKKFLRVDNYNAPESEIKDHRELLENLLKNKFPQYEIPIRWLILSIYLKLLARKENRHEVSFSDCVKLGAQLGMKIEMVKFALQFLHKYVGLVMYFPKNDHLKDIVICDPQIVFTSISELIFNIYDPSNLFITEAQHDKFVRTGCFCPDEVRLASKGNTTKKILSLETLVHLLVYLNIIAEVPSNLMGVDCSKRYYFMPAVLQTAELSPVTKGENDEILPEPLCIRFSTGYIPLGFVCALSANLIAESHFDLIPFMENGQQITYKNKIRFRYQGTFDIIMMSHSKYCEFHVSRCCEGTVEYWDSECCPQIRKIICKAADRVVHSMQQGSLYKLSKRYELAFKCPHHPMSDIGQEPLAKITDYRGSTVTSANPPQNISCVGSLCKKTNDLSPVMKVWFGKAVPSSPPFITKEPSVVDDRIKLQTDGTKPLKFQWYRNNEEISDGEDYKGSTTPKLVIVGTGPQVKGEYKCRVNNKHGELFSKSIPYYPFSKELKCKGLQESEIMKLIDHGISSWIDFNYLKEADLVQMDLTIGEKSRIENLCSLLKKAKDSFDVIARTSVEINNKAQCFDWKDFGLRLAIPENSLSVDVMKCHLEISVCSSKSCPVEVPNGYQLVSAVYKINCIPKIEFKENLQLEIQHCARSKASKLCFAQTNDENKSITVLESGVFKDSYGFIQLSKFSFFMILVEPLLRMLRSVLTPQVSYAAILFYKIRSLFNVEIKIAICKNLRALYSEIAKRYIGFCVKCETCITMNSEIELNIEDDSVLAETQKKWKFSVLVNPMRQTRETIDEWSDQYSSVAVVPSFQLTATFEPQIESQVCELSRKLILKCDNGEMTTFQLTVNSKNASIGEHNVSGTSKLTMENLKRNCGVTDNQLETKIEKHNLQEIAACFDKIEDYLDKLGLIPSQQTDIKDIAIQKNTDAAIKEALKLWRQPNPFAATYRALLKILLDLNRGDIAIKVCEYISENIEDH